MTTRTRIVLCDDHPVVLAGLHNLLAAEGDIEVVGTAVAGHGALKLIRETLPDVALIDISMPEINGILLSRRLAQEAPQVRVIVLTLHESRAYLKQALDAGVHGYVLKRTAAENLLRAVRTVMTAGLYIDPTLVDHVLANASLRRIRADVRSALPNLTEREEEVLKMAAQGFTTTETARRLDIGVKTAETYKARGLEKLGLQTRSELVRYAAAEGWLSEL